MQLNIDLGDLKLMRNSIFIGIFLLSVGCGENSDGSDKSTYSSCSIVSSSAVLAADRARDVSQCWDGVDYRERSLAMDWCAKKVNRYMARYIVGHDIQYQVSSTNCPKQTYSEPETSSNVSEHETSHASSSEPEISSNVSERVNYSIQITLDSVKANGNSWDAFGGKPDIKIYIDNEYKGLCKNSFKCTVTHVSSKNALDFKIYDEDVVSDDFVGKGSCTVNDTCKLGQALVTIDSI